MNRPLALLVAGTFFMENLAGQLAPGPDGEVVVRLPMPGDVPLQMVAVRDIGAAAARLLLDVDAIEGDAVPQVFIPQMLALYQAGLFPFDELITTYAFEDIEQAIADTQSGVAVKAVLTMS